MRSSPIALAAFTLLADDAEVTTDEHFALMQIHSMLAHRETLTPDARKHFRFVPVPDVESALKEAFSRKKDLLRKWGQFWRLSESPENQWTVVELAESRVLSRHPGRVRRWKRKRKSLKVRRR